MKKNKSKGWKKSRRRRERRREADQAQGTNAGPEVRRSRSKKAGRQIAA